MRQTNNSMSSMFSPPGVSIKQEPGSNDQPSSNQKPSAQSVLVGSGPQYLQGAVDFAAVAGVKSSGPPQSNSFQSIPKPVPKTPTLDCKSTSSLGVMASAFATKRRENHDSPEARLSKVPCNHVGAGGGFDTLDDTIKNVTSAFDKERRKFKDELDQHLRLHQEELNRKDGECAEEIRKARSACAEEAQKALAYMKQIEELKSRHAGEIDDLKKSFAHELGTQKAQVDAAHHQRNGFHCSLEDAKKRFAAEKAEMELKIAKLQGSLDATDRGRREDFRNLERQLDDREARHRNQVISEITTSHKERLEAMKNLYESEGRNHLSELRVVYERKIASLESELAALKGDGETRKDIRKLVEAIPGLLEGIYSGTSQLGVFKTQVTEISAKTQEIHNQAIHLQGYMAAAMQRPGPVPPPQFVYYPPMQQHPAPVGRGRHGAFHSEPAHAAS